MSDDEGVEARRPVFGKVPSNWEELSHKEKDAWSLQFLLFATRSY